MPNASDDPSKPWFAAAPIGENILGTVVKDMHVCRRGHCWEDKPLRATGATQLYTANVPQKIIQQRTGHRSLKSQYINERTTEEQQLAISKILTSDKKIDYTPSALNEQSKPEAPEIVPNIQSSATVL